MDSLGWGLLFLPSFIDIDEVSVALPLFAENSIKAGVDDVHDGLVELQEPGETLGVLFAGGEGEAVGGQGVVPGECEVAVPALLLHFIYKEGRLLERTYKTIIKILSRSCRSSATWQPSSHSCGCSASPASSRTPSTPSKQPCSPPLSSSPLI